MLNETKFNFNSAICTSKVQSERLLALGLKKETADMSHTAIVRNHKVEYREDCSTAKGMDIPAWSLHRLMEMTDPWEYKNWIGEDIENDYDNMIQCISFLIEDRRFDKEYLEE